MATALIAATAVAVVLAAMSALWPVEYERTALLVEHPLALPGGEAVQGFFTVASNIAYFGFQLMFAVCLLVRMVVADAEQSRQLWWFVGAAALSVVAMVLSVTSGARRSAVCSSSRSCRWRPGSRWSSRPTRRC